MTYEQPDFHEPVAAAVNSIELQESGTLNPVRTDELGEILHLLGCDRTGMRLTLSLVPKLASDFLCESTHPFTEFLERSELHELAAFRKTRVET